MNGILLVDKPAGYTSHDVVAIVKRAYRLKKVGHTGTLDPLATGILPLCINAATQLAGEMIAADKQYEATLKWGEATDTFDAEGKVVKSCPVPHDIAGRLQSLVAEFTGPILQTPPPYSAVKVNGKPLYWWARQGVPQSVPPREITVYTLSVEACTETSAALAITCSKGTFIRSLVHDIGQRIGCGAHVTGLRRLATGDFHVADAISLDEIKKAAPSVAALARWLIPIEEFTRPSPGR